MKNKNGSIKDLYWQNGYGAFSVDPAEVDVLVRYIESQKEDHRKKTFQHEYRGILEK